MRRSVLVTGLLVCLLCELKTVQADAPATQPAVSAASQPAVKPADTSSPLSFLASYDRLAGQDPAAYRELYYLDKNDETERLAAAESKFDAQVGMLQKIVQQLWGDDGVDEVLHNLGLKSMRDIRASTIKEAGNTATVIFADGTHGPDLIKTPQGWRLNLPAFQQSLTVPLDEYLKQIRQISKVLPDVAEGIEKGKLTSVPAVAGDIAKRINPVP